MNDTSTDQPPTAVTRHRLPVRRRRIGVRRTRIGGWWVALVAASLVLLLLLIFVLQNGHSVRVSFLGAHGDLPLGIGLLLAGIAGVLIVAIPGSGRILQLRHLAQRRATPGPAAQPTAPTEPARAGDETLVPDLPGERPGLR